MTTQLLVEWAFAAETVREDSWIPDDGVYGKSITTSVKEIKPAQATHVDCEIVIAMLYHSWNEVQDWYAENKRLKAI